MPTPPKSRDELRALLPELEQDWRTATFYPPEDATLVKDDAGALWYRTPPEGPLSSGRLWRLGPGPRACDITVAQLAGLLGQHDDSAGSMTALVRKGLVSVAIVDISARRNRLVKTYRLSPRGVYALGGLGLTLVADQMDGVA